MWLDLRCDLRWHGRLQLRNKMASRWLGHSAHHFKPVLLEKLLAMVGSLVALYCDISSDRRARCKHQRAVPTAWLVCLIVQTHLLPSIRVCAAYTVSISCHMLSCARTGFVVFSFVFWSRILQACQVRQRLCNEQRPAKRPGVETASTFDEENFPLSHICERSYAVLQVVYYCIHFKSFSSSQPAHHGALLRLVGSPHIDVLWIG